jgi:hypothetical protein
MIEPRVLPIDFTLTTNVSAIKESLPEPTEYQLAMLMALQRMPNVYVGSVDAETIAKRRAKNKIARKQNKYNRGVR